MFYSLALLYGVNLQYIYIGLGNHLLILAIGVNTIDYERSSPQGSSNGTIRGGVNQEMLFGLIVIYVSLLVLSLVMTKCDLLAPANIYFFSYIIAMIFAMVNVDRWNWRIHNNTVLVLITGGIITIIISAYYSIRYPRMENWVKKRYNLPSLVITIATLLEVVSIVLTYKSICEVTGGNLFSLSNTLFSFRLYTVYHPEFELPVITKYLSLLGESISYVLVVVFCSNVTSRKDAGKYISYLFPKALDIIRTMMSGARSEVFNIFVAFLICYYIMHKNRSSVVKLRSLLSAAAFVVIGLIAFMRLGLLFGRDMDFNPIYYLSIYIGAPIKNLDSFLNSGFGNNSIFGQETFFFLNRMLSKFGLMNVPESYSVHLSMEYVNGLTLGNVYTAYRRWYNDFGYIGSVIMHSFFIIAYSKVYYLLASGKKHDLCLLTIFSFYIYPLFLHFFDDKFYRTIFSSYFVIHSLLFILTLKMFASFAEGCMRFSSSDCMTAIEIEERRRICGL